ncbi:oligosaccharyl transferase, archaeosortase A system-associated [Methanolobus sp. ZRKC2]|uniref:oligosaccharyl transferase, archaeosortase A system-associated n=1 Tax=Methanolobus sp. ZRKC2 TaxID=3125783 RepID=UPI003244EE43
MKNVDKITNSKLLVVFLVISAFLIRLSSLFTIYSNGKIIFVGADPFYHVRRIVYSAQHFPDTITFDTYLNYPFGYEIGWPPLYDQVIAFLALVVGNGNPSISTIEMVSAIFPALLGALTILPLYYLASAIFDKKTAIASAVIISLIPAHLIISEAGFTDHHVAEVLLSTTAYALLIIALKQSREIDLKFSNIKTLEPKLLIKPVLLSIAAGLILALTIFTWIGSPIFLGLVGLYIFVQFTADLKEKRQSEYALINVIIVYTTILLFIVPIIERTLRPGLEVSGMFLSWFHVTFVVALLLASSFSGIIAKIFDIKNIRWMYYPVVIITIAAIGTVLINQVLPSFYQNVIEGMEYLGGDASILGTIAQARPLLFDQTFTLVHVWNYFTIFSLTAIIGLAIFTANLNNKKYPPEMVFFFTWTIIVLVLTLSQRRFAYMLAINFAVLSGYFVNSLYGLWKNEQKQDTKTKSKSNSKSKSKKAASKTPVWETVTSASIMLIFIPIISFSFFAPIVDTLGDPETPSSDWQESLEWLEANSPETSFYLEPEETPEYGVLSWWDYGNWILYIAKRPVVANNFQTGIEDSSHFFATTNESDALSILEKRNVKYVITDNQMTIRKSQSIFDVAGESYYKGNTSNNYLQEEEIRETTLVKLHLFDGSDLGNLRLIHESEQASLRMNLDESSDKNPDNYTEIKNVKIFEYVPGATIEGFASPGQNVSAKANVTLDNGRTFEYQNKATSDNSGWYELKVPYSNATQYNQSIEPYYVTIAENANYTKQISVEEADVINGNRLRVDFIPQE